MSDRGLTSVIRQFPTFQPARLLRNGHAQTIFANLARGVKHASVTQHHRVLLDDDDIVVLHENCPDGWSANAPTALLVHGLAGCANSGYMTRTARKLNDVGVRVFRMDLRACGAGEGLARMPYHPGITQDLAAALNYVARMCPLSPVSLAGFSIGGNLILKLLGERTSQLPRQLDRAVVINPPIDLPRCLSRMTRYPVRFYNRHFVGMLYQQFLRSERLVKHAPHMATIRPPRGLREFDSVYTSPMWGYKSVDDFYEQNSALSGIGNIKIPTLVIASQDDPLVPADIFDSLPLPDTMALHMTDHGGHLGFINRNGSDPDRRWMDWRVVDWIMADLRGAASIAA